MTRKCFLFFIPVGLSVACNQSKPYTYIETVNWSGPSGDSVLKYRAGELIHQATDSAAYVEAYRKFITSKSVNAYLNKTKGPVPFRPFDFKLLNADGIDISKTINFSNKGIVEERMEQEIKVITPP